MSQGMPATRPVPRPGVLAIHAYVPGKSKGAQVREYHKLSSNETPLGASPKAIEAYRAIGAKLELYPDGASTALREAIGETMGINPNRIVCGNGSDDLLGMIAHAYIGPGDEAIFTEHGFLVYAIQIRAAGATPVVAPEKDRTADVDAILEPVTEKTKLVFLANPDNPMGSWWDAAAVQSMIDALPTGCILCLDEAYSEFTPPGTLPPIDVANPQVLRFRTFSKAYGLAGCRVGYAIGEAGLIKSFDRLRNHFGVNRIAPAVPYTTLTLPTHHLC